MLPSWTSPLGLPGLNRQCLSPQRGQSGRGRPELHCGALRTAPGRRLWGPQCITAQLVDLSFLITTVWFKMSEKHIIDLGKPCI